MSITESIWNALEAIVANPLRSFLTMLGVIIGVFAIVSLITLGEGAREYVNRQFSNLGTNVVTVTPGGAHTSGVPLFAETIHKLTMGDVDAIRQRCPSVARIAPIVLTTLNVKYGSKERVNAMVIGTESAFHDIRNIQVSMGQQLPRGNTSVERHVCIIGQKIRRELFGKESNPLGKMLRLADSPFRVIGVLEPKGVHLGFNLDDLVLIPVKSAQDLTDSEDLREITMQTRYSDLTLQAIHEVRQVLIRRHNGYEDFTVINQGQMVDAFGNIMGMLTVAISAIAGVSLMVGGIGIMNIMMVSVGEKTREIGIRKAIGARNSDILLQFLVESASISTVGGGIGVVLSAVAFMFLKAFFPQFPAQISWDSVVLGVSFSTFIGVFFGVYPARKAARLDPIHALRYD